MAFGVGLAVVELVYNIWSPSWWPFIVVDYIAVILLLYGALRSLRILSAGWGFAAGAHYMAFFVSWGTSGPSPMILGLGLLFAVSIWGLLLTVRSALSE